MTAKLWGVLQGLEREFLAWPNGCDLKEAKLGPWLITVLNWRSNDHTSAMLPALVATCAVLLNKSFLWFTVHSSLERRQPPAVRGTVSFHSFHVLLVLDCQEIHLRLWKCWKYQQTRTRRHSTSFNSDEKNTFQEHEKTFCKRQQESAKSKNNTNTTTRGSGGSFKNRKPIGEIGCFESRMAEQTHWWIQVSNCLSDQLTIWLTDCLTDWLTD